MTNTKTNINNNIRIYLASGFFNEEQIASVERVEKILRAKGLNVWSPRENQLENYESGTPAWSLDIFMNDVKFLNACDIVVAIADDGNTSDAGTMVECGMAYKMNKPIIAIHVKDESNLMLHEASHANLLSIDELEDYCFETLPARKYEGKMF